MIDVVGVGAEGFAELPASLQERVLDADVVLGGARHLAMLPFEEGQVREPWPSPLRTALPALLERFDDLDVVALASGDPLVSGIRSLLSPRRPERPAASRKAGWPRCLSCSG